MWVVIDGSTDDTDEELERWAAADPGLRVWRLPQNRGKGAAIFRGLIEARAQGFTHVLTMDADGQHDAAHIPDFMAAATVHRDALILGVPIFDQSAPALRVRGRKISNWWANLETLGVGVRDSLCGFRVYPVPALCAVMTETRWMRRFDFDAEAVVRLCWRGLHPINLPVPVRYFRPDEGGVSHFRYGRDNAVLSWMHLRLFGEFLFRLPILLARKLRSSRH